MATTDLSNPKLTALLEHLDYSVSPSHSVERLSQRLMQNGFEKRTFGDLNSGLNGQGFIADAGLLLAWKRPRQSVSRFKIVGAHTDSPGLKIKPLPDTGSLGWKQLGVEVYGGILNNSWLDRDLGVAGRVILRDGRILLARIDRPLARIPQLAIHLDRDVNERGLILDKQLHLLPIWGLGVPRVGEFLDLIAEHVGVTSPEIMSFDMGLFDLTAAALLGQDDLLLTSGRLDNQVSCWAAVEGLIDSTGVTNSSTCDVVALFDHEEVGSQSSHGAAGPRLEWVLRALQRGTSAEFDEAMGASHCISADNAHAVHPNYPDRHEPLHRPLPNMGPVIKVNANQRYATTAESMVEFVLACQEANIPHQIFVSKNSVPCGSTIGPLTSTQLGVATVDVGVAQLSMHSARELCGAKDPLLLAQVLARYFSRA